MRRAVVIQHNEIEGPGAIADVLVGHGVGLSIVRTDLGHPVPSELDDVAALVVMGGPMSARSDEGFPSRSAEIDLVRRSVDAGIPLLGVCLGAQILAAAMGGEVVSGTGIEVGWSPVHLSSEAVDDRLFGGLADVATVLHWHGETYRPPCGAVHLASSAAYEQQAFRVGEQAWGLQFHVEVDVDAVVAFADAFPAEAAGAPGGRDVLLTETPAAVEALRPWRDQILTRFASLAAST